MISSIDIIKMEIPTPIQQKETTFLKINAKIPAGAKYVLLLLQDKNYTEMLIEAAKVHDETIKAINLLIVEMNDTKLLESFTSVKKVFMKIKQVNDLFKDGKNEDLKEEVAKIVFTD